MAIYQFGDHVPQVSSSAWAAESAQVIGRVTLEDDASVWYGAVLRGDNDTIHIGRGSNIQDACVLHVDAGYPLRVGSGVTVGHQVMLHGCSVGDGSLIGIQSIVLNGARIGRHCLVGAGSVIGEGKEFPDGVLILGTPARVVRELTPEQIARLQDSATRYVALQRAHRSQIRRVG